MKRDGRWIAPQVRKSLGGERPDQIVTLRDLHLRFRRSLTRVEDDADNSLEPVGRA